MNVGIQIKALTRLIYNDAIFRLKRANADPIISEIIMENVLSKFRDEAYTTLALETISKDTPGEEPEPIRSDRDSGSEG